MSSYHSSFSYLGKNSASDFNWIITHFADSADSGETETGLSTESIYTASADGTRRNLYGTKYSGAEPIRITVIKSDRSDFSIKDNREALKWLTGAQTDSWLDLYVGDEVKYRLLGHVQNVLQYKMDSRVIGLIIVFESASPFAFSPLQKITVSSVSGTESISIDCPSDDVCSYVYANITYTASKAHGFRIQNKTTGETTKVENVGQNETVTINSNQFIFSDNPNKILGNDFNFVWPRLKSGINNLTIQAYGDITIEYIYPIKIGDCVLDTSDLEYDECIECTVNESALNSMLQEVLV